MGKKQSKPMHQPFEANNLRGRFAKICHDMMDSPAWKNLSLRQQGLYLAFKKRYCQKKEMGEVISSNQDMIKFPKSEFMKIYGDDRTFRKDLKALIENGFIHLVESGRPTRTPNLYGFSERWKTISLKSKQKK